MKAVICTKYGSPDVLQLAEVKKPVSKDNEVLIRIYATSVTTGDVEIQKFKMPIWLWLPARIGFGLRGPRRKILGQELKVKLSGLMAQVKVRSPAINRKK